ncbi:hypothetical protein, unlikely [Trypanosoma brucei gambiense DAL972]|uniref:Uncharacterized protein n=1 Tax=Trypanosoma brucei gambiense (strain MHOM/CI/86/DAL972) TaxID=679716 RepID=C9ZNH5_TRYB9|nr:hypothetical protein, unlikely [Trypanosoma brucei gambiense DAL972]CBH10953.1 hypothetical protein, unlikely [Trypanosoma brucei gambiense DAL972]|eukprot:XP_011773240.1 hypothetical protein, unlikely [Trypanosoma brucei gambiense DAL972]
MRGVRSAFLSYVSPISEETNSLSPFAVFPTTLYRCDVNPTEQMVMVVCAGPLALGFLEQPCFSLSARKKHFPMPAVFAVSHQVILRSAFVLELCSTSRAIDKCYSQIRVFKDKGDIFFAERTFSW